MTGQREEHAPGVLLGRLFRQGLHYLSATAVAAALQYATVAVLTRLLTQAEFGAFSLFQAVANFVAAVAALNFQEAANRYWLEDPDDFPGFLRTVLTFLGVTNVVLLAGAWWLRGPAGAALDLEAGVLFGGVLVGVLRVPWLMMWKVWVAQMRSGAYGRVSVARDGLVFAATVLAAWAFLAEGQSLRAAIGGAAAASFLAFVGTSLWLLGAARGGRVEGKHLSYAVRFGFPLIPSTVATTALNVLDRVIIQATLGLEDTATYSFAYNIGMVMSLAVVAVVQATLPVFTRLRAQEAHADIETAWRRVAAALSVLALGLVLFAREAAFLLGDERYLAGLVVVPWVVLGYFARAFAALYGMYAVFHKRTWVNGAGNVLAAVLNAGLNLWLIPRYGYPAAAWTTFASFLFLLVWYVGVAWLVLDERRLRLRVWLVPLLVVGVALPATYLLLAELPSYPAQLAVKAVGLAGLGVFAWRSLRSPASSPPSSDPGSTTGEGT